MSRRDHLRPSLATNELEGTEASVGGRIVSSLDAGIRTLHNHMECLEASFEGRMERHWASPNERIETLDGRMGNFESLVDDHMGTLGGQIIKLDGRIGTLDGRMGTLDGRVGRMERLMELLLERMRVDGE